MLVFLLFCASGTRLEAGWRPELGQPIRYELGTGEAGEGGYTWDVVWDEDGVAYFARDELWRWDGTTMRVVGPKELRTLRSLARAPDGRIWVGGINLFGVYDPCTNTYTSQLERLPADYRDFDQAWSLFADDNAVWLGAYNRLFRLDAEGTSVWEFDSKERVLFYQIGDFIVAHERFRGLWRIDDKSKELVCDNELIAAESINEFGVYDNENYIAISQKGLFLITKEEFQLASYSAIGLDSSSISSVSIGQDLILIGTLYEGIMVFDRKGNLVAKPDSLQKENFGIVLNIKNIDKNTFLICESESIKIIKFDYGMGYFEYGKNIGIEEIKLSENGNIYYNSSNGLYFVQTGNNNPLKVTTVSHRETRGVREAGGVVYFDQYDRIMAVDGEGMREVLRARGEVMTFEVMGSGRVVVCYHGGVWMWEADEGGWRERALDERLTLEEVRADGFGRLWGWDTRGGLWRLGVGADGYGVESVGVVCGRRLEAEAYRMEVNEWGAFMVFAEGVAVNGAAGEWEWWSFAEAGEVPARTEWVMGEKGLEGWLMREGDGGWELERVSKGAEGVFERERLAVPHLKQLGRVYDFAVRGEGEPRFIFAGGRGILLADAAVTTQSAAPGRPIVYEASGVLRVEGEPVFPYGRGPLAFRFSVPGKAAGIPVTVESRLVGRDVDWVAPLAEPYRELGQLFEGRYALEVRARDPLGRLSEVAVVRFRVLPPWYRSLTAYVGYLLLAVLSLYAVIRLREHRSREREASLASLVRTRTEELERANEFKNEFIANLSHEIRNPLNGVIGFIQQLRPGEAPPAPSLKALRGAAQYLRTTVEDVLDFAKLESGQVTVEDTVFDLRELLGGVVEIYREQAEQKGLLLTTDVQVSGGLAVRSDSRKLQQIVGNLASNAIKFTERGHVHVGILLRDLGESEGLLRIWVEDSGRGISAEVQERIFEKFFQVREEERKTSGTGLGLTLVQRFVDLMGGALEVESELGRGSTFFVSLPVGTEAVPLLAGGAQQVSFLGGVEVLVVEDMEYNRILLKQMLSELGCAVDLAEDGLKGLEMAREGTYQAIFLDWDLPGMNGLEVARALRADGALDPSMRIIGMTAAATVALRKQCLEAGMNEFLGKPVSQERLREMLQGLEARSSLITGKGLLAELTAEDGWAPVLRRWERYYMDYSGELRMAMVSGEPEAVRKASHRVLGHLRMLQLAEVPDAVMALMEAAQAAEAARIEMAWMRLQPLLKRLEKDIERCIEW